MTSLRVCLKRGRVGIKQLEDLHFSSWTLPFSGSPHHLKPISSSAVRSLEDPTAVCFSFLNSAWIKHTFSWNSMERRPISCVCACAYTGCIYMCVCTCVCINVPECMCMWIVHVWQSEDDLMELVFSFHFYLGSGHQTWVFRVVPQALYLLIPLAGWDVFSRNSILNEYSVLVLALFSYFQLLSDLSDKKFPICLSI